MNEREWLVLTVDVSDIPCIPDIRDAALHEISEALVELGAGAIQHEQNSLRTYLPMPSSTDAFLDIARSRLARVLPDAPAKLDWRVEPAVDWSQRWRHGLRPRRVGRRLVVSPTWTDAELRASDLLIRIDPEMAFGTGEHGTTRSTLRLAESAVSAGDRVLDVGAGSGILSIAAALLGAREVIAAEADADALENAAENIARNGAGDVVRLQHAWVTAEFLQRAGTFDAILANVLSGVLLPLLPAFHDALAARGRLVLSGILDAEADVLVEAAADARLTLVEEQLEDEWWSGLFRKS